MCRSTATAAITRHPATTARAYNVVFVAARREVELPLHFEAKVAPIRLIHVGPRDTSTSHPFTHTHSPAAAAHWFGRISWPSGHVKSQLSSSPSPKAATRALSITAVSTRNAATRSGRIANLEGHGGDHVLFGGTLTFENAYICTCDGSSIKFCCRLCKPSCGRSSRGHAPGWQSIGRYRGCSHRGA